MSENMLSNLCCELIYRDDPADQPCFNDHSDDADDEVF